ncbi:GIY-YIG nuclease family protein [Vibrio ezurae]|uniref:GIY-YIG domain-containing protein n=1 Tax=Vibrio ezurae NBRC 102218 TaxID=1219080 RepID=U3AIY9_9VIBR|nr:GIY-YIG nuclease family protein [Vibrio ezurae]GAD79861.1 hypothetical protein VEZ01S_20_01340 [Vibrio ezurae NBRC 102218]
MLNKLIQIGFKKAGDWSLVNEVPSLHIESEAFSKNVLYCFVVAGNPKYVGKTTQILKKRMYGYEKPGTSQSTNIKNNKLIVEALKSNLSVELFVLPDNGLLYFGEFHVNLAAGLEDSIVKGIEPEWNRLGK